ncbi:MAG: hypothetical protein KDI61_06630 [Alphaproteobacteria bacterium]|nr:hypothetical protein [Alphaproteobacteria bacterium]MCB1839918.1 hypothetical protein [Alphaproteobacteria bacterium]
MKKFPALSVFLSSLIIAGAIVYHAETGRYQIESVGTIPAAYRVDTRTGEVSVCSPLSSNAGCQSIESIQDSVLETTSSLQNQISQSQDQFMESAQQMMSGLMGMVNILEDKKNDKEPDKSGE